jgi:hypothetical protein
LTDGFNQAANAVGTDWCQTRGVREGNDRVCNRRYDSRTRAQAVPRTPHRDGRYRKISRNRHRAVDEVDDAPDESEYEAEQRRDDEIHPGTLTRFLYVALLQKSFSASRPAQPICFRSLWNSIPRLFDFRFLMRSCFAAVVHGIGDVRVEVVHVHRPRAGTRGFAWQRAQPWPSPELLACVCSRVQMR